VLLSIAENPRQMALLWEMKLWTIDRQEALGGGISYQGLFHLRPLHPKEILLVDASALDCVGRVPGSYISSE
jgi:hypothetical protein